MSSLTFEDIKQKIEQKLKQREESFEENIACPHCESKNLEPYLWCAAYGGAVRLVFCKDCTRPFAVYWDMEEDTVYHISIDSASGMV